MAEHKRLMMLMSIVQRNSGQRLINTLNDKNITLHFQCVGFGTAPTEMMDIFGLGTNAKDIVISIGAESTIKNMMADFGTNFSSYSEYGGLMIVLKMSAASRLVTEILNHNQTELESKGDGAMKNEHHNNLILISVNNGYADPVMETAKKAGATGGTIVKGRLADAQHLIELGQMKADEERELICILAPSAVSHKIMEDVNKSFGITSDANGILCAVPTEKAYKI